MIERRRLRATLPAALLALALAAQGCGGAHDTHQPPAGGTPVAVQALTAGESATLGGWILPGRVRAREEVMLAARITGRLTTLPLREGAAFRRGQVLARFDAPETRDAVNSARERAASARARLEQARTDEARMQALVERNVVSDRDLELARVARHEAEAVLSSADAELLAWLENAALTAPFDGIVVRRHVDPGQTLTPGQPILDLRSRDVGEIEVTVPESALSALEGAAVAYQIGEGPWQPATLVRVDGMTDPGTRTRRAWLRPEPRGRLEPGAYARVRVQRAKPAAGADSTHAPLVVPATALVRRGALTGVFVLRDDRAWLRWLRVGREADGRIEVLAGLSVGDVYAADPKDLVDGCAVTVAP